MTECERIIGYLQHVNNKLQTARINVVYEFAPKDGEKRFEKNVNSAFHPMTGLPIVNYILFE